MMTMNKQDKELLLKDLCARLPYGVRVAKGNVIYPMTGVNIALGYVELAVYERISIEDARPYLRPMSSMTDKERGEINELVESESSFLSPVPTWYVYEENIQKYVDFCLSHHLDCWGMIPKGLALEAPDGMYD